MYSPAHQNMKSDLLGLEGHIYTIQCYGNKENWLYEWPILKKSLKPININFHDERVQYFLNMEFPPLPSNICFAFLPSFYFKTSFERSTSQSSKLSKIFGTFSKRYAFFLFSIWAWMGQIQWNEISNLRQKNHKWILQKLGRFQPESNFFFRLLCVSIVVLLLAMCASAVITWGKALWDSEPFPESKLSEAEWYMYFYS